MSTSKLFPAPLLALLTLPIWATTLPLAMFYTATALFLLVAGFFFGLQAPAGFVIGFALMVIPPACFSVVVYIRAVERLAPVEVVTPTRAYHLVVALLTAALVVYMAVNLLHEHSAPHFFWIIGAVLAIYFALFIVHTYFEPPHS